MSVSDYVPDSHGEVGTPPWEARMKKSLYEVMRCASWMDRGTRRSSIETSVSDALRVLHDGGPS